MPPLAKSDLDHILDHTAGLWDELRGRRIFITGGTGFFGCWMLESFAYANTKLRLNAQAVILTRNPEAFQIKAPHLASYNAIRLHVGDVKSFKFPDGEYSHIIHAAAESSPKLNNNNSLPLVNTILEGTRRTLEFAEQCGVQKFLFTSSGAVYGKQPSNLNKVPEDYMGAPDTMKPNSAYGESKRMAEHLCIQYALKSGIETKIARCFAFIGPYLPLNLNFAIGNFIRDGMMGEPIHIKGDGTTFRSYLYAADLAIWLWSILMKAPPCRAYNVGSEHEIKIAELAKVVANCFCPAANIEIQGTPASGRAAERYVPSTKRVQLELNLHQTIDLIDSIRKTIAWYSL